MGYLNKEAETKEVMTEDNWLKLGDLGYIDEGAFVSVLGKESNFITLTTGEVISPFRVRSIIFFLIFYQIKLFFPFLQHFLHFQKLQIKTTRFYSTFFHAKNDF